jgi:hypothetical protein
MMMRFLVSSIVLNCINDGGRMNVPDE